TATNKPVKPYLKATKERDPLSSFVHACSGQPHQNELATYYITFSKKKKKKKRPGPWMYREGEKEREREGEREKEKKGEEEEEKEGEGEKE
ncbi:MAG: hypothetical protein Q9161_000980, partial [Pseudevernia consocians]